MEPGYVLMIAFAALLVGIVVGRFLLKARVNINKTQGVLYVDPTAPEGLGLFLEQTVLTSDISTRDHVVLKVVVLSDTRK